MDKVYQIIFEILCGLIVNILYDYLKKQSIKKGAEPPAGVTLQRVPFEK